MSKAVMISIKPKWCELIASGKKTVEVRKSRPTIKTPFKCYVYCTKAKNLYDILWTGKQNDIGVINRQANGYVIGEFVCKELTYINAAFDKDLTRHLYNTAFIHNRMCIKDDELFDYLYPRGGWGWHISDLVIYDKLRELNEFKKINRNCWYEDLGLAKIDCPDCQNQDCFIQRPPQSWCYVEEEAGQALKNKL